MTQGSSTPLGLHLQLEDEQGRGRDQSQGYHRGCSSAERIGQRGLYSTTQTHCLLSHEQTLAVTSHRDILSTCLPGSWTNRCLAGLANKPRLFGSRVPGPAEPRVPAEIYSTQCRLHSEGHSQSHIPSTSASSSGSPRRCLLLTFSIASTGWGNEDGGSSHQHLLSLGPEQGSLDEPSGTKSSQHH